MQMQFSSQSLRKIALVACDDFYVSCERVFNPKLEGRPVVVLSNNDSCVIACSQEARGLGIEKGMSFFNVSPEIKKKGMVAFSSNYALYSDMSARFVNMLQQFAPDVYVCAANKCFLDLSYIADGWLEDYVCGVQKAIKECLGLSVSVGVGPNKTLAKLAGARAKADMEAGKVCVLGADMSGLSASLARVDLNEMEGIGCRWVKTLKKQGIFTAEQLRQLRYTPTFGQLDVSLQRYIQELWGEFSFPLDECVVDKESVSCSGVFQHNIRGLSVLGDVIASFARRCGERLHAEKSRARAVMVCVRSGDIYSTHGRHRNNVIIPLAQATDDIRKLIQTALAGLNQVYKRGLAYVKASVVLLDVVADPSCVADYYGAEIGSDQDKPMCERGCLGDATEFSTGKLLSVGLKNSWISLPQNRSPRYTTHWGELMLVR